MIWRQVWVEGHMHLLQLHHIIQAAMGWTDAHLHDFTIGGVRYGIPHEDDPEDLPQVDERTIWLDRILDPGLTFEYQYDFGDSWIHIVWVEQSKKMDQPYGAGFVQAGARTCPPEDAGGSTGYQEFLDLLAADPRDEEVVSFLKWAGEDFDPGRFDRRPANAALLRMAWNRGGEKCSTDIAERASSSLPSARVRHRYERRRSQNSPVPQLATEWLPFRDESLLMLRGSGLVERSTRGGFGRLWGRQGRK